MKYPSYLLPDSAVVCAKCGHYLTDSYERDRVRLAYMYEGHVCGTGARPDKEPMTMEQVGVILRAIMESK